MATQLLLIAAFVFCMLLMSAGYKKRKKRVMFVGGASINTPDSNNKIYQFLELLKKEEVDDKYEIQRAVIASERMQEVFESIELQVLDKGPDIVLLNFSAVDIAYWNITDIKEFDAFYKSIIKRLIEAKITVISSIPEVRDNDLNAYGLELFLIIHSIQKIAANNKIETIDIKDFDEMNDSGEEQRFAFALFSLLKN